MVCEARKLAHVAQQFSRKSASGIPEADFLENCCATCASFRASHTIQLQDQPDVFLHIQRRDEVEELIHKADVLAPIQSQLGLGQCGDIEAVDRHCPTVGT